MRALVYTGHLSLETALPLPQPEEGEALLKIRRAGICNTDLELIQGMYDFSGILGHEFVAEVVQGPDALVGRRVVGEININCEACDFCRSGIPSQCRNRKAIGIHGHSGAFADYLTLPVGNLYPVPDDITDEAAVFVEPLAAAAQILDSVHISSHDRVIVIGVGKLGMLAAQVIKLTGADVIGVVRREKQAKLLHQWGIPTARFDELESQQANIIVDCTGQADGFADALNLVRSRGTIILKSTYRGLPSVDLTQVAAREIRVIGSRCGPFGSALRLLQARLVDVKPLIEAQYPFDQALTAIEHAKQPGALKILLNL